MMPNIGKLFIFIGLFFITLGGLFFILPRVGGMFFGKLPGDIRIHHGNFYFYFPITSCILISIILTIILSLLLRK